MRLRLANRMAIYHYGALCSPRYVASYSLGGHTESDSSSHIVDQIDIVPCHYDTPVFLPVPYHLLYRGLTHGISMHAGKQILAHFSPVCRKYCTIFPRVCEGRAEASVPFTGQRYVIEITITQQTLLQSRTVARIAVQYMQ